MTKIAIVADDLTGALDTAGQWARWGVRTSVICGSAPLPGTDAVAVHTASRAVLPELAYARARAAAQRLRDRRVYKKLDSTLRGNIGAEIEGLLDGLGLRRALIAPAFPAAGRTVQAGILSLQGVPLDQTEFSRDPQRPARESHVPTLVSGQTRRAVGHLPLETVRRGDAAVRQGLLDCSAEWVVADATEVEDLYALARAAAQMPQPWLCCGSAGLAEGWLHAQGLAPSPSRPFRWPTHAGPVLVVAGSRHPATARQLGQAQQQRGLHLVDLSVTESEGEAQWSGAVRALAEGRHVALSSVLAPYQPGAEASAVAHLARATAWVCARSQPVGLFLTGGDTADAACAALHLAGLEVLGEVLPGIPAAAAIGGRHEGLRVVTKAGGFGDDQTLVRSLDFIQGA